MSAGELYVRNPARLIRIKAKRSGTTVRVDNLRLFVSALPRIDFIPGERGTRGVCGRYQDAFAQVNGCL